MNGIISLAIIIGILWFAVKVENLGKVDTTQPVQRLCCPRCGGININVSINTYQQQTQGTTKIKKRSLADRTAQKAGRGMMNMATLGVWGALTPKQGKYKEYHNANTKMIQQKVAICQQCGTSWNIR